MYWNGQKGYVADERVILLSHCEINFAGVRNVEVRPAISTDTNPNPNRKLSLLEMAKNNTTRSSATLPTLDCTEVVHPYVPKSHVPVWSYTLIDSRCLVQPGLTLFIL